MQYFRKSLMFVSALLLIVSSSMVLAQGNSQGNSNGNGNGNGRNKNIGVGNASDGIMGQIVTGKDIAYSGDPLDISLRFPRGADLISGGEADAYVVIFAPVVDDSNDDISDDGSSDGSSSDDGSSDDNSSDDGSSDESSSDGGSSDDGSSDDSSSDDDEPGTDDSLGDAVVLPVSDEASETAVNLFSLAEVDVSILPAGTYQLGLILTNPGGDPLNINDWYEGLLGLIDVVGLTISDSQLDFDADGDGEVDDDLDGDGFSDSTEDEDEESDSEEDQSEE